MSVIYFDTARLGQACPHVRQTQHDFSRLSADDPSMYGEEFFRAGISGWSDEQILKYPGFKDWEGIQSFKTELAEHFDVEDEENIFLANRSAQLVRIAARLMFRTCRNVLTSDLNWPHWQSILLDEAARSRQRITVLPVRKEILTEKMTAGGVVERLATMFENNQCDGVFLPSVNNFGVKLPLTQILKALKATGRLRYSLIDAAQSFCHLPEPAPRRLADVTITGCHKWLGAGLPMGIAVCGRPLVAEQIRTILNSGGSADLDDPLLKFSHRICHRLMNHFGETVNVAPLFSANAAIRSVGSEEHEVNEPLPQQSKIVEPIRRAAAGSSWNVVNIDESFHSDIVLMQSSQPRIQQLKCDELRSRFYQYGVALSTYSQGVIRISAPPEAIDHQSVDRLSQAFAGIG